MKKVFSTHQWISWGTCRFSSWVSWWRPEEPDQRRAWWYQAEPGRWLLCPSDPSLVFPGKLYKEINMNKFLSENKIIFTRIFETFTIKCKSILSFQFHKNKSALGFDLFCKEVLATWRRIKRKLNMYVKIMFRLKAFIVLREKIQILLFISHTLTTHTFFLFNIRKVWTPVDCNTVWINKDCPSQPSYRHAS